MRVDQSIIKKDILKKIYPNSGILDDISNIFEIHKKENNISIWERNLDSEIIESAKNILTKNPEFQISEIIGPENVKKKLFQKFNSNQEYQSLSNDISFIVDFFAIYLV